MSGAATGAVSITSSALDTSVIFLQVTGKDLLRRLRDLGCEEVRQVGSDVRMHCGKCVTTVPVHAGQDLPPVTLRAIERDLEPCLGRRWLGR